MLNYTKNAITDTEFTCHHYLNKSDVCDNCISIKAYKENEVFIKLEYHQEKVYMILAIPVTLHDQIIIVELFKDVSNNMSVVKKDNGHEMDIHALINNVDDMLFKDHLTGIFNRRYIDERLQVDIINNTIYTGNLSLIMADIDLFKDINDEHGHQVGDYILKEIAGVLNSCVRMDKDWLARYGGEEFFVCLPNTNKERAYEIAERMRLKIEETTFTYEGIPIKLTTSFGVYTIVNNDSATVESAINIADENLYKAKKSGRNKVISS